MPNGYLIEWLFDPEKMAQAFERFVRENPHMSREECEDLWSRMNGGRLWYTDPFTEDYGNDK